MKRRLSRWWADPRIPLSPVTRLRISWIMLAGSLVGWLLTAIAMGFAGAFEDVVFRQGVMALSWLALTITAFDVLSTSDVSAEVGSD